MKKGFTLIELLVVIAVLAVLVTSTLVLVNPSKRFKQANDARIKQDIRQISNALLSYYTTRRTYPNVATWESNLTNNSDIKTVPLAPNGGRYNYLTNPNPCVAGGSCEARIYFALNDPAAAGNVWCWRSATGLIAETAAPPAGCNP